VRPGNGIWIGVGVTCIGAGPPVDWMAVPGRSLLLVAGLLGLATGCTATAATGGAVPIDRGSSPPTTGVATDTSPTTPALASPTSVNPIVAAVGGVLGGQAVISRPVNDDGSRPDVHDDRVFILGDSITEAAGPGNYDTIRKQLTPLGWRVTIDAKQGRNTEHGIQELRKHQRDIHDVVVILLGHNDPVDTVAYRKKLDEITGLLADVPLVVFLTNYEFEAGRDRMNDQLRVIDALHDNVELVDWNAVAKSTKGAIGPDGLHPTERGAEALAATIAVTLGVAPDGPADTTVGTSESSPTSGS
jgi:lysophospholipase L1-like esterase